MPTFVSRCPARGEAPTAPIFIDGKKAVTLRDSTVGKFNALLEDCIEKRFGVG